MLTYLLGFKGERLDPLTHTYLINSYRVYDPHWGFFQAPDSLSPFGAGGIHPYAYCLGDPINRIDPSGQISLGGWLRIGLTAVGLIGAGAGIALSGGAAAPLILGVLSAVSAGVELGATIGSELAADQAQATAKEDTVSAIQFYRLSESLNDVAGVAGWTSAITGIAGGAAGFFARRAARLGAQTTRSNINTTKILEETSHAESIAGSTASGGSVRSIASLKSNVTTVSEASSHGRVPPNLANSVGEPYSFAMPRLVEQNGKFTSVHTLESLANQLPSRGLPVHTAQAIESKGIETAGSLLSRRNAFVLHSSLNRTNTETGGALSVAEQIHFRAAQVRAFRVNH